MSIYIILLDQNLWRSKSLKSFLILYLEIHIISFYYSFKNLIIYSLHTNNHLLFTNIYNQIKNIQHSFGSHNFKSSILFFYIQIFFGIFFFLGNFKNREQNQPVFTKNFFLLKLFKNNFFRKVCCHVRFFFLLQSSVRFQNLLLIFFFLLISSKRFLSLSDFFEKILFSSIAFSQKVLSYFSFLDFFPSLYRIL